MRISTFLSAFALAGTVSLATAIPRNVVDLTGSSAQQLDKRAPADLDHAPIEARGGGYGGGGGGSSTDVNVDVNVKVKSGRPSYDYSPDDSGWGYGVDWNGHGPPSWCPHGWQWYGRDIGWAPYRGWQPPRDWTPSAIFVRVAVKVSWWSPPSYCRNYWSSHWDNDYYRYGIPKHWNWRPRNYNGGSWYHHSNGGYYWRYKDGYRGGYGRHGSYKRDEVAGDAPEEA